MREGMTKDSKFTVPSNPEAQARIAKLVDQMQGGIPGKGKRAATSDVPPLAKTQLCTSLFSTSTSYLIPGLPFEKNGTLPLTLP